MHYFHFYFLIVVTAFYWAQTLSLFNDFSLLNRVLTFLSGAFQTLNLLGRWLTNGTFPLSNLYESLLFLSWALTSFIIVVNFNLPWLSSRVDHFFHKYGIEKLNIDKLPFMLNKTPMQLPKNKGMAYANSADHPDPTLYHDLLGSVLMPMVLLVNSFIFFLPDSFKSDYNLVPALQSNWLQMHVVVMISAYAFLLLGCLLSIAYLVLSIFFIETKHNVSHSDYQDDQSINQSDPGYNHEETYPNETNDPFPSLTYESYESEPMHGFKSPNDWHPFNNVNKNPSDFRSLNNANLRLGNNQGVKFVYDGITLNSNIPIEKNHQKTYEQKKQLQRQKQLKKWVEMWDNYSYRSIGLGFPLLTMGLLSGAVWANQTWGSYWSWDPKETWALITWFIFAIYLHTRLSKGWSGRKSAWLALFGFITLWVCYLGVNLMAKGLHSYGFLR